MDAIHLLRGALSAPALAVFGALLGGATGCHRPPDLRVYCEKRCACGCDVDACVKEQTAYRDRFRTSEACSRAVDEMTTCEIEHGACEKKLDGSAGYQAPECGQIFGRVMGCERR